MPPNPLNLKQRLAALSMAPSSLSPPLGADTGLRSPAGSKRKAFNFNPPWMKRPQGTFTSEDYGDHGALQEVLSKMIFQAGVDFETRPMVVVNASALPDPERFSYDLLLSRILSYLNLYVESDYTVVFFAAGGRHTPGWNWVWRAYRSLSRKYRKNLKQMYIVHSSFFSKMLFSLAGAIISPKFFRKLTYIRTLSELAGYVPLTQIDIPPAVYQENLKYESKIVLPVPTRSSIFGVSIEDIMGFNGEKGNIPRVIKDTIHFLRASGMEEEGLFRRSPSSAMLRTAQEAYDRGNVVSLNTFGDPHLAAVLLKKYLRDLPEPIFPESLYSIIRRCPPPTSDPSDMSSVTYIRENILSQLSPCVYIVLSNILHLMHDVSLRSASNRMDAHNLAIVLCPNLVKGANPARDVMMCGVPGGPALFESRSPGANQAALMEGKSTLGMVIKLCIQRYYEIFDDIQDRSEAITPRNLAHQFGATPPELSDEDEDIDDAMLVMPIGPSHRSNNSLQFGNAGTLGTWTEANNGNASSSTNFGQYSNLTGSRPGVRSVHTAFREENGSNGTFIRPSAGKARSFVTVENGLGTIAGRKGSISIGRGTTRKSYGAGVEAIGITAEGFFSPPSNAPPVPKRIPNPGILNGSGL